MTIQVASTRFASSKQVLETALNTTPDHVHFDDPSIFPGSRGHFNATTIQIGEKFAVVMDPQTRRRFATVQRKLNGQFKVS